MPSCSRTLPLLFLTLLTQSCLGGAAPPFVRMTDDNPLAVPVPGSYQLRVIAPSILELNLITTKAPDPAPVQQWDFTDRDGNLRLPAASEFVVEADGEKMEVQKVGFKRRVLYAPLWPRDLRIANELYLQLARAIPENRTVRVKNPSGQLWPRELDFSARTDPQRWSPAIHVNQVGFFPDAPKKAMAGYYLGSLGELDLGQDTAPGFKLVEASSGKVLYEGRLTPRPDHGFTFPTYERVMEMDFTPFKTAGEYRIQVPGLGVSFPFRIDEGTWAAFARTYALGLYHQRCGTNNVMPFTRFTHDPCHTAAAFVPSPQQDFTNAWRIIASEAANGGNQKRPAPAVTGEASCLYPFVNKGRVNVAGGHHDAGDYSKYTINSVSFLHLLVFALDNFPGIAQLDNLGLPESGDGKGDIVQEAKWEADFLSRMQDEDGGFYFLVYPRDRQYESNVTPDQGDPQIVWPKTTSATAGAVAALAQCASSPAFKKQFPEAAGGYLEKARKGWAFLERAIAKYSKDGAYQKLTHYGNEFGHNDELAWAACEMFLATGDQQYHRQLLGWFDPANPDTRRWGWWRVYECYGNVIRSYAFAAANGRVNAGQLDLPFLTKCQNEIAAAGEDQFRRARDSAYGTSFPAETKRARGAGWYFSEDAAFDLAVAMQLDYPALNDPRPKYLEALLSNLNYAGGCNPVNVTYLTGLGWKRQHNIVDQFAVNAGRVMPPPGIPLGNIQEGFMWLDAYKRELGALSYPLDGAQGSPYPFYDRWGDSFNVSTEFVILNQARALGVTAFLMARTGLKDQPWKFASGAITGLPKEAAAQKPVTAEFKVSGLDLSRARIYWDITNQEPVFGPSLKFVPLHPGLLRVEAECVLPDGRYVFASTNINVQKAAAK